MTPRETCRCDSCRAVYRPIERAEAEQRAEELRKYPPITDAELDAEAEGRPWLVEDDANRCDGGCGRYTGSASGLCPRCEARVGWYDGKESRDWTVV